MCEDESELTIASIKAAPGGRELGRLAGPAEPEETKEPCVV